MSSSTWPRPSAKATSPTSMPASRSTWWRPSTSRRRSGSRACAGWCTPARRRCTRTPTPANCSGRTLPWTAAAACTTHPSWRANTCYGRLPPSRLSSWRCCASRECTGTGRWPEARAWRCRRPSGPPWPERRRCSTPTRPWTSSTSRTSPTALPGPCTRRRCPTTPTTWAAAPSPPWRMSRQRSGRSSRTSVCAGARSRPSGLRWTSRAPATIWAMRRSTSWKRACGTT